MRESGRYSGPRGGREGTITAQDSCLDCYLAMQYTATMDTAFFANWTTQLRKGILELCVLSAIRGQRLYGYDIVKTLRTLDGLVMSEGTIYPILSRFKREGL